jgi:hypothetical protein
MWRIVLMTILCMQLVACSAAAGSSGKTESTPSGTSTTAKVTPINAAVEKCNLTTANFVEVMDDGHSVILLQRGMNKDNKGFDLGLDCVMQELGIPTYISYLIIATGASDGMQKEENDAYKIYWKLYDDSGENRNVIIHMK